MNTEELITSSSNQVIKLTRSLHQKKKRDENELFLVEGIHHVGSVIEAGWEVHSVLYSPELLKSDYSYQLIESQKELGIKCYQMAPHLFKNIAGKENPQGILAIVHQQLQELESIDLATMKWGIAIVAPQDPGNVGTIIRTMDSVGADCLFLLDGGVDPFHPSCVRAGMGALFWKPVIQTSFSRLVEWCHVNGYKIVGSSAHADSDYRILASIKKPNILLLGNEQRGLTSGQIDSCDLVVSLPMQGHSGSLNLSVAAGVLMYAMLSD